MVWTAHRRSAHDLDAVDTTGLGTNADDFQAHSPVHSWVAWSVAAHKFKSLVFQTNDLTESMKALLGAEDLKVLMCEYQFKEPAIVDGHTLWGYSFMSVTL